MQNERHQQAHQCPALVRDEKHEKIKRGQGRNQEEGARFFDVKKGGEGKNGGKEKIGRPMGFSNAQKFSYGERIQEFF
jgi:hypothetical protein